MITKQIKTNSLGDLCRHAIMTKEMIRNIYYNDYYWGDSVTEIDNNKNNNNNDNNSNNNILIMINMNKIGVLALALRGLEPGGTYAYVYACVYAYIYIYIYVYIDIYI